jgi:molybdopterin synthase sulfur carrier subunit
MSINVRIPTPLRNLTENLEVVPAQGGTISEIIDDLQRNYPGLGERICDENGEVRRFLNIYVNNEDIRFQDGKQTPVNEGDELSIIPAIAGGNHESLRMC